MTSDLTDDLTADAGFGDAGVLVVCTANFCRSPAAQLLLQTRLTAAGQKGVRVASAGTRAHPGGPVHEQMAALLRADGVDPDGFTSRLLADLDVDQADLVITMSRDHRAAVVRAVPRAVRRTFTLLELAHLLSTADGFDGAPEDAASRWKALPALATSQRSRHIGALRDLDVPDPIGRSARTYRSVYRTIAQAVDAICRVAVPSPHGLERGSLGPVGTVGGSSSRLQPRRSSDRESPRR